MKTSNAILGGLMLTFFILFSCNDGANDKKEAHPASDAAATDIPAVPNDPTAEVAPAPSSSDLPVVNATTTGEKYIDWGSKPVETEEGPADPWTMPFMMCAGPSFMDGQLKASSSLAAQGEKVYSASNVSDDDPSTAWVEGKPDYGVGEYLEMEWTPMGDGEISILNGYQSSKSAWESNSRVKAIKVSMGGKEICTIALADVMGVQKFKIPGLVTSNSNGYEYHIDGPIRFTIAEVYPGLKYKDTAISGIFSCGG